MMRAFTAPTGDASVLRALIVLVGVTIAARVVLASTIGLGIDEAYTVATSRVWAWSTYDHPPLAWWLARGAAQVFGRETPLVVRFPFILLGALSTILAYDAGRYLFGARAGFYAAATLNLVPVLAWTGGSMVLPDGPLLAALLAGLCCLARALFGRAEDAAAWWLLAGIAGGLACLSKLHGVFLFAGTGLFILTTPAHRHWLRSPWPYLAAVLALAIFSPVLIWNAQHGWISFAFQAARAKAARFDLLGPVLALGGQALFVLPWIWAALAIGLVRAARSGPRQPRDWLLFCLAIGPIAVFTLVAIGGTKTLFHWAAPGYLFACLLLGRNLARDLAAGDRGAVFWWRGSIASLGVLFVLVLALARFPWPVFALPGGKPVPYPLIETQSWGEVRDALAMRGLLARPGTYAWALKWHEAARIDVALGGAMPVRCWCADARGFGVIYDNREMLGHDAIIIAPELTRDGVEATLKPAHGFKALTLLDPITIHHAGQPLQILQVYLGQGLFERPDSLPKSKP